MPKSSAPTTECVTKIKKNQGCFHQDLMLNQQMPAVMIVEPIDNKLSVRGISVRE